MSFIVGPTSWWVRSKEAVDYYARACPVGSIMPDGSVVYCKAGGLAWIWAPPHTSSREQWAGGQYNTTSVGSAKQICCVNEWQCHCARLIAYGFNPCDWFIPSLTQAISIYNSTPCLGGTYCTCLPLCYVGCFYCFVGNTYPNYWSTEESSFCNARGIESYYPACCFTDGCLKTTFGWVRSIRCIPT